MIDRELLQQEPVATDWERIARVQNAKLMAVCDESEGFEKLCEVMDRYERTSPPAQRKPLTDEPVRIYDYVWPQRDEHKEECVYACSYTPGHHLARGELLAVVHPSQLKNAYLQRDAEAAHGIN